VLGLGVRVVSWNHAASRELRDTADELVELNPHGATHRKGSPAVKCHEHQHLTAPGAVITDLSFAAEVGRSAFQSGPVRVCATTVRPVPDADQR
jgi:hypothetical protein